jgi:hypothetical protein
MPETGELWRDGEGNTFIVSVCGCGVVHARGIGMVWRGTAVEFAGLFSRIETEQEQRAMQPSKWLRRRGGVAVR